MRRKIHRFVFVLAAALALAPSPAVAGAVDAAGPTPDLTAPRDTMSPCACAANPRCWRVVMLIDAKMTGIHKEEVEKALPNRFFPDTLTFTMRRPSSDGHFLIVKCGSARRPCPEKRDVLEARLIKASILESLPLNQPKGAFFDPETFQITDGGEKVFIKLKQCKASLLDELAAVVLAPAE